MFPVLALLEKNGICICVRDSLFFILIGLFFDVIVSQLGQQCSSSKRNNVDLVFPIVYVITHVLVSYFVSNYLLAPFSSFLFGFLQLICGLSFGVPHSFSLSLFFSFLSFFFLCLSQYAFLELGVSQLSLLFSLKNFTG